MKPDEWDDVEQEIVRLWGVGDSDGAKRLIDTVLVHGTPSQRARALTYLGSLDEDREDWVTARRHFEEAAELATNGSYQRYAAEISVARVDEITGSYTLAAAMYRRALETCACADEAFSGATALKALLPLYAAGPAQRDIELERAVVERSCRALELDPSQMPDTSEKTIDLLLERASSG